MFVVLVANTPRSTQCAQLREKNYNSQPSQKKTTNKARAMRQLRSLTSVILLLGPWHFPRSRASSLIQNQPIHDQPLLYCLVKRKCSLGTVEKKELEVILGIVCRPRRNIFPHQLGLLGVGAARSIYTGSRITRRFPGIVVQWGSGNACRVCLRVTQNREGTWLSSFPRRCWVENSQKCPWRKAAAERVGVRPLRELKPLMF